MAAEEASSSSVEGERRPHPRRPARDFALTRLARRAHSTGELSTKMARAGYLDDEIHRALDYLNERGYLDDASFATDFARTHAERRRWGPARIQARLESLGIEPKLIDTALELAFERGERHAATLLLERFLAQRTKPEPQERKRARAYRHLISRGFAPDLAHELVSSAHFDDTERLDEAENPS